MKLIISTFYFLLIQIIYCFSQSNIESHRSMFFNGIQLTKPQYTFQWSFKIDDIPKEQFINYTIFKQKIGVWTNIKFDSVILGAFSLQKAIVKATKKKNEKAFTLREFVGFVDFETIEKMASYFNYNWKGWILYPKNKPLYRFRLYKDKKEAAIVIDYIIY